MGKKNRDKISSANTYNDVKNIVKKYPSKKRNEIEINNLIEKLLNITTVLPTTQLSINKEFELYLEIHDILEKIRAIENDSHNNVDKRTIEYINLFTEYMKKHGAKFENLIISEFSGYDFGLKAEKCLQKNSNIISIPRSVMMCIENAEVPGLKDLINQDILLQRMPNVGLALYLLIEKYTPNSFWKPYIDILPNNYTTVLYFTPEEMKELKGSPTFELALKQCRNIARQYAYLNKLFSSLKNPAAKVLRNIFSYEEYRWAVSTVMTRQNSIPSKQGSSMITALIPLWDMCNHTNGHVSTDFDSDTNSCQCFALKDFQVGEQLMIFYGIRTNSELFLHNGFVYPENEHDGYWLRLGISKSDKLLQKKNQMLERLGLNVQSEFFIRPGTDPIDDQLVIFLRIFNMSEDQLDHWLSNNCEELEKIDTFVDSALDNKVWNFLLTRLKLLLASYPTSLQQDTEFLKDSIDMSPCQKVAIQMRVSEKIILLDTVNFIEKKIQK